MPFKCKKSVYNLLDSLDRQERPFIWNFESDGGWEEFEADYKERGNAGSTFEKVNDREFIFVTSNASHCTFVRTDV